MCNAAGALRAASNGTCRWALLCLLAALLVAFSAAPAAAQDDFDDLFSDEEIGEDDLFGDEETDADDVVGEEEVPSQEEISEAAPEEAAGAAAAETAVPEVVDDPALADEGLDPGLAVETPDDIAPSAGVEEIVVQGQAAAGLEADATVSVTSFDAADLDALGVTDVSDVASFTPNLEIRTAGATTPTFFIRGIGLNDFTANASGAIAIYQDDVSLSLPAIQLGQLFDVENLQIQRGPQGGGSARNASGGAIRIYSRKPTGDLTGNFKASFGRYSETEIEGALGVPIIEDVLASRVAFVVLKRDPIARNRCSGAPRDDLDKITSFRPNGAPNRLQPDLTCGAPILPAEPLGVPIANPFPSGPNTLFVSGLKPGLAADVNDIDRWAARSQFRFTPPDTDMDWLLNIHGGRINQDANLGQPIGTGGYFGGLTPNGYRAPEVANEEAQILAKGDFTQRPGETPVDAARRVLGKRLAKRLDRKPFTGDYNRTGKERLETVGGSLRGDFEFKSMSVTSITAIERYDRSQNLDADYTPDIIFEFKIEDRAWQFSQELRAEGELEDLPVHWNAGVFYLMDQLDFNNDVLAQAPRQSLDQVFDQETWSLGAFAGFEWEFLDDFTFEGAFRFNWERKEFEVDLLRGPFDVCGVTVCHDQQTWQDPSGTAKLSYAITDEVTGYASYSRGFKSGQYSVGGASGNAFTVASPETVDSFELGVNGSLFDGRLDVSAAVFHYTYENYQVFLAQNDAFTPPQRVVVNADDAILYGAELETTLVPFLDIQYLEGFRFISRFGWIESEFLDFTQRIFRIRGLVPGNPLLPVDVEWTGNRLPNTPRFKWSTTLEYTLDMGRYGSLIPRYDGAWTDDSFFDASDGRGIPDLDGNPVLPEFAIGQEAYWLHNFRLAWRNAEGNIEVAGWVRNMTNEVYKTLAFDASEASSLVGNQVGQPRTYGLTVSLNW